MQALNNLDIEQVNGALGTIAHPILGPAPKFPLPVPPVIGGPISPLPNLTV